MRSPFYEQRENGEYKTNKNGRNKTKRVGHRVQRNRIPTCHYRNGVCAKQEKKIDNDLSFVHA